LLALRESLNLSQALLARHLRVSVGTVQNWEQGLARVPPTASLLLHLVARDPQLLEQLATI
jgi:putative transcriptional regulator